MDYMVYRNRITSTGRVPVRQSLLARLQGYLLPPRCIACGNAGDRRSVSVPANLDLCNACHVQLPLNLHACRLCALPLPSQQPQLICGRCLQRPPPYQLSLCAYEYAYPITHLIRHLKYGGALAPARVFSVLLMHYLRTHRVGPWPECFIPVPLHATRYRARGYNQVIELGRGLEHELRIPMRTDLITRNRHTPEQAGLSRRERRKNLHRAFVTTHVALPRHVALLDDVITTGSTMNELARTLKNAGVTTIEVWGLARAANRVKNKG